MDAAGVPQRNRNLANDPAKLMPVLGALPPGTPVAFAAAYVTVTSRVTVVVRPQLSVTIRVMV